MKELIGTNWTIWKKTPDGSDLLVGDVEGIGVQDGANDDEQGT